MHGAWGLRYVAPGGVCQAGGMERTNARPHVVIVGGGISGLAAAFFLRDEPVRVTVLEGSPRLGGKLSVSEVAGVAVDEGAEALLVTRPEGTAPDRRGRARRPAHRPGTHVARRSGRWARSGRCRAGSSWACRPIWPSWPGPACCPMTGVARASQDLELPPTARDGDVPVAAYIGARLGARWWTGWSTRCLAGSTRDVRPSCRSTPRCPRWRPRPAGTGHSPRRRGSLLPPPPGGAVRRPRGTRAGGSVFTTLTGGLGMLPAYLAKASGAEVRTAAMVRELAPAASRLAAHPGVGGGARADRRRRGDPRDPGAARGPPARGRARRVRRGHGARRDQLREHGDRHARLPAVRLSRARSGRPAAGAGTWCRPWTGGRSRRSRSPRSSGRTWPTRRQPGPSPWRSCAARSAASARRRCCSGPTRSSPRWPRPSWRRRPGCAARPVGHRVTRWGGALPQYTVGHLDRVAAIRAAVAAQPGLAVCGAAYDGVGIPACVATARAAVRQVLAFLAPAAADNSDTAAATVTDRGRQWWHG